jgi:hypothetical protein
MQYKDPMRKGRTHIIRLMIIGIIVSCGILSFPALFYKKSIAQTIMLLFIFFFQLVLFGIIIRTYQKMKGLIITDSHLVLPLNNGLNPEVMINFSEIDHITVTKRNIFIITKNNRYYLRISYLDNPIETERNIIKYAQIKHIMTYN